MLKPTWFYFAGMACAVIYVGLAIYLNRYLRLHHAKVWEDQGKPTFWNNSPANGMRFVKFFIFTSSYKRLEDQALNPYVILARICMIIGFASFFALVFFTFDSR